MVRPLSFFVIAAAVTSACNTTSAPTANGSATSPAPASSGTTPGGGGAGDPAGTSAGDGSRMQVTTETLEVSGAWRSYVLAVPSTYAPQTKYPLVLVLHGDNSDGPSMREAFPFDAVSKQAAFVAYPTGTQGWDLYNPADKDTDLTFLAAIVDSLAQRFNIDRARVFGTGFSSGAFMVNQVGCRRPGFFRGIASHSGGAPDEPNDPTASRWANNYTRCANQTMGQGPAVMVVHGTADNVVAYDSGTFTAAYWAYVNGCSMSSAATSPSPCMLHDACPAGRPVMFCGVERLNHAFWAEAATATWQFFQRL